jgi:pyrophosphatase PpaX
MAEKLTDYEAYLFDWDGTLAQTVEIWLEGLRQAYEHFGIVLSREILAQNLGDWSMPIKNGIKPEDIPEFNQILKQKGQELGVLTPPLFDGVLEMLRRLKEAHKKLVLITSSERQVIDIVLSHHEITELFDLVITVTDVKAHKPDPEGILFAIEKLGTTKEQAVMLGDSDKDLGAAKNAGVDSILFYPKTHELVYDRSFLESFKPVAVLHDWNTFYANRD